MPSMMVARPCTTDAKIIQKNAKILVTIAQSEADLNDTIKFVDLKNPQFSTKSGICLL